MSYDFYIAIDTGGEEPHYITPFFSDEHPILAAHAAGTSVLGGGRCGNYTSNVSPIWSRCLTAVMGHYDARAFAGADDRRCIETYGPVATYVDGTKRDRTIATDELCLRDFHGAECDCADIFRLAVEWGAEHIEELRALNSENVAGCYQEWDIPFGDECLDRADEPTPGTWRWPVIR